MLLSYLFHVTTVNVSDQSMIFYVLKRSRHRNKIEIDCIPKTVESLCMELSGYLEQSTNIQV